MTAYGRPPAYGQVKGARVAAQFIPRVLFLKHLNQSRVSAIDMLLSSVPRSESYTKGTISITEGTHK